MELLIESIKMDWPVLLPILICSILVLGVVINKWSYFKKNRRDIAVYMRELNRELESNDLRAAQDTALRCGGVVGEVIEEAVRIFNEQKKGFSRAFDISATLATRKLESNLTILGTIGGVAPFLGLFGTVVRILLTFKDMAGRSCCSSCRRYVRDWFSVDCNCFWFRCCNCCGNFLQHVPICC